MMLRVLGLVCVSAALVGCAGNSSSRGIGSSHLASVNPSQQINKGPLTPAALLDVAPAALSMRLGPPAFKRAEPDAEVWQYAGSNCALFVYFYKAANGALASTYVDARKTLGGPADTSACLADVVSRSEVPVF